MLTEKIYVAQQEHQVSDDDRTLESRRHLLFIDKILGTCWPRMIRVQETYVQETYDDHDRFELGSIFNRNLAMIVRILPLQLGKAVVPVIVQCKWTDDPDAMMTIPSMLQGQECYPFDNKDRYSLIFSSSEQLRQNQTRIDGTVCPPEIHAPNSETGVPNYTSCNHWVSLMGCLHQGHDPSAVIPAPLIEAIKTSNHSKISAWAFAYARFVNQRRQMNMLDETMKQLYCTKGLFEEYSDEKVAECALGWQLYVDEAVELIQLPFGPDYCLPTVPHDLITTKYPSATNPSLATATENLV